MHSLTWQSVWRRRLAHHFLMQPCHSIPQAVRAACGIHAQVQASAEISIGLRVDGITQLDVQSALWERKMLVRTYGLRGTVHLFAADEVALWLAAFRAKAPPGAPNKIVEAALPSERVPEVIAAMRDALDGNCLTREELSAALEQRLGDWVARKTYPGFATHLPPWQLALSPASTAGVLAFGPSCGTQVRYVRLDQWLGADVVEVDGQHALREVLRRFLHAYGPATPAEFARWFYTSPKFARGLFEELCAELEEVDVEGWRAWRVPGEPNAGAAAETVHILPYFDAYVVGGYPRERLIPEQAPPELRKAGSAAPFAVLLVDGVIAGLWRRDRVGKRFTVRVDPFVKLSATQRDGVEARARRVGEILQSPIDFSFGKVEPKGHW